MRPSSTLIVYLGVIGLMAGLWSCGNAPQQNKKGSSDTLPPQPEAVFRTWQAHIDRNEFEQARKLSTAATVEWIDMISTILFEDPEETETFLTKFLELRCTENADTASCVYLTEEEGIQIQDSVRLLRINGQWLVDFTEEEELSEEELEEIRLEIKEFFGDSLEESIPNLQ